MSIDFNHDNFQKTSLEIWDKKYRLKDRDGNPIDETINDTFYRVAKGLAAVEEDSEKWEREFLWALEYGAIPAGRITSNVATQEYKPNVSLINCTVSNTIEDSMEGILDGVKESGITLSAGCGIGYEFSTLRPKGSFVDGVGATTSGPLSFMNIYDSMCFTVASAGGRRGAQMATFDISHPDVLDFIKAKREDGTLRQFNMSVLVTSDFMQAVKEDAEWQFIFPVHKKTYNQDGEYVWKKIHYLFDYHVVDEEGRTAHQVFGSMPARELYDLIMKSTYDFAEPGFILIDEVNKKNNLWFCEDIRATNPCGEQPLPPYGSCLLGSINLTKFVSNPFTDKAKFNFMIFKKVVNIFTRMLDNVVELNGLALEQQQNEIYEKRRHGMGYLGLGSVFVMLGIKYGSEESIALTEEISKELALEGWRASAQLAVEKGSAPIFKKRFPEYYNKLGLQLFLESEYMQQIKEEAPEVWKDLEKYGSRFSHHTSIAPTGTISLALANNSSNGIEPSFSHSYYRNVIKEGKNSKEQMEVVSNELFVYRQIHGEDAPIPEDWEDAGSIDPFSHIYVQAASQKWIDSSISKTINVPTDYPFEKFTDLYMYAYDNGLKGCTTFRFNPEAFQGVLVTDKDLENTTYVFTLEDGTKKQFKGNETIEYEGEEHSAANLYDAIKEGYYGKF